MQSNEIIYVDRSIFDSCVLENGNAIIIYTYIYPIEMIKNPGSDQNNKWPSTEESERGRNLTTSLWS